MQNQECCVYLKNLVQLLNMKKYNFIGIRICVSLVLRTLHKLNDLLYKKIRYPKHTWYSNNSALNCRLFRAVWYTTARCPLSLELSPAAEANKREGSLRIQLKVAAMVKYAREPANATKCKALD